MPTVIAIVTVRSFALLFRLLPSTSSLDRKSGVIVVSAVLNSQFHAAHNDMEGVYLDLQIAVFLVVDPDATAGGDRL